MNPWLLIFRLKALHLSDTVCVTIRLKAIEQFFHLVLCINIVQVYSIKQLCDFVLFFNTLYCTSQVLNSILENTLLF